MRKIKEVLRLNFHSKLSQRSISRALGLFRTTVGDYLRRAKQAQLSWPLSESMADQQLCDMLFPATVIVPASERATVDCAYIHNELKRKGVTLMLLWEEYQAVHPHPYRYSRYCQIYRRFARTLKLSMRQVHLAGEKLFVDYSGQTISIVNPQTGEIKEAQVFVAVLGASNYTFAEATLSQGLSDWLGSHRRAFEFYGGVPQIVVPDNLRSAVTKSCRYEPDLNPSYQELAQHYSTAVIPARVRKPQDKSKAEVGVQIVERWILARLRKQTFFSLAEANDAIGHLLLDMNNRPFKKLPGTRRQAFESLDQPVLQPLPATPYEFAQWKKVRVNIDYHIELDGHYYSVPFALKGQQLDARSTSTCVECYHQNKRVASHCRSFQKGQHTTVVGHMPKAHQSYAEWTPERLIEWGKKKGPQTASMVAAIIAARQHPQQGFRSAMGLLSLSKTYGSERLESACRLAITGKALNYKSVKSILKTGLDQQQPEPELFEAPPIKHDNIRGGNYYTQGVQ